MRRQRRDRRRPRAPVASFWAGLFLLLLAMVLLRPPEETPPPAPTLHPRAAALLSALPGDLEPSRRALVETACTLVGRVDYFWGGKSTALGWDSRWGTPARVTAPGCGDTGRIMPFGLDCSGYLTWIAVNALEDPEGSGRIGDGVRDQYAHCTPVAWAEARPGDLVFFPDLSHVGLAAGRNGDGALAVLHCSRSLGGVVVTEDAAAAGFTLAGRPAVLLAAMER